PFSAAGSNTFMETIGYWRLTADRMTLSKLEPSILANGFWNTFLSLQTCCGTILAVYSYRSFNDTSPLEFAAPPFSPSTTAEVKYPSCFDLFSYDGDPT